MKAVNSEEIKVYYHGERYTVVSFQRRIPTFG